MKIPELKQLINNAEFMRHNSSAQDIYDEICTLGIKRKTRSIVQSVDENVITMCHSWKWIDCAVENIVEAKGSLAFTFGQTTRWR